MRLKNVIGILLSLCALVIVGCGGGGNDGGPGGTAVSGTAAKGPITGATVQAFEIISSASTPRANIPRIGTTVLATGTTAADGSFSLTIPTSLRNGGVLFKLTGGSYKDEATGATVQVNSQAANGLRAAFGNISGIVKRGQPLTVNVTPFTELGFQTLGAAVPTDAAIAAANARVVTTFGLTGIDILTTKPFDATTAPPANATQAQKDYALALAILSQSQKDSAITLDQLNALLLPDVNAGTLSVANSNAGNVAELNFLNSGLDQTGGVDLNPVLIAVTPAVATTAAIGSNVTITATVTQSGVPVPAGTEVKFAIESGTGGTLTPLTTTTNASGVATTTLTSDTDAAAYVVTASAGGHIGDAALITFANPNKPGSINFVANPATGVTNGLTPVILTANVAPAGANGTIADGTPVNFTILTGSGALTAVTTTTGGVATATLNSTVAGTVTAHATAGTAPVVTSNTVSVPFINQPVLAVVTVATSGTLPPGTLIGGINATLTYAPTTFTIADADVTFAGLGLGTGTLPIANTTTAGQVQFALINAGLGNSNINATGTFATLNFHVPLGTFTAPTLGLINISVIDTVGVAIPGVTVVIQSTTLQ